MVKAGPLEVAPSASPGVLAEVPMLILAGGKATRLKNLSADTPKYLMPVSTNERFADLHLSWVHKQGFRKVILSVGYLADAVRNYCGNGSRWDLQINYVDDGANPQGTGGAVALALQYEFNCLAITYGDTLLSLNSKDLYEQLMRAKAGGLMTLYPLDLMGHQANAIQEGPYARYSKKNPQPGWNLIDYGFLFLERHLIESFPQQRPLDLAEPLETFCQNNEIVAAVCKERFWEIGSPESLQEFQHRFQSRS